MSNNITSDGDAEKMVSRFCGSVIRLGDDINTDLIYPGKYLQVTDPEEIALHALEGLGPEFPGRIGSGDIVVAGNNFGCGSSREGAVTCLKAAGVAAVIATSFARIFYRNMINQGFLPVESPEAVAALADGDEVCVDVDAGEVTAGDKVFGFQPPPPFIRDILNAGGLVNYTRRAIKG